MISISDFIGKKRGFVFVLAFIVCMLFTAGVVSHRGQYFDLDTQQILQASITSVPSRVKFRRVLLPAGFKFSQSVLDDHLTGTSAEGWEQFQLGRSEVMQHPPLESVLFKPRSLNIYEISRKSECHAKQKQFDIYTGESAIIPTNLSAIFDIFNEEEDIYGDTYNRHIGSVFKDKMSEEKIATSWFVFSGSSVWLKSYNVHLVVSRLVFTEIEDREKPRLSMVLAQIFDENWREIEDVRLVFPTNDVGNPMSFQVDERTFTSYRFPRILPIPFLVGDSGRFWGAEDPRVFLPQNKDGYEEPVIVFNAVQAKEVAKEDQIEVQSFRSIFLSFPFQTQQGKRIYTSDKETEAQWFSRIKQIKISGQQENHVEKNWTPLVDSSIKFKEHMYFATSLSPLKIIKCELWTANQDCVLQHAEEGDGIGALRGGTPLLKVILFHEEDKEVFIGLARAHISGCGCGYSFYRPNFVVVARKNTQWMISHVSSSVDLGMPIVPWTDNGNLCDGVNAMIPNGIESWDLERDRMSVFVSISDSTVERVYVGGVLEALKQMRFLEAEKDEHMVSPMDCAMNESRQFCEDYAKEIKGESERRDQMGVFKVSDFKSDV